MFTVVASRELARYGVTANAVYPTARTRMTEDILPASKPADPSAEPALDPFDPANFAPVVVWLGSERSSAVTGRVFGIRGGRIVVAEGWSAGPTLSDDGPWEVGALDEVLADLVVRAAERGNRWPSTIVGLKLIEAGQVESKSTAS